MTAAADWQAAVGRNWAREAARTDRSFAGLTPHLRKAIDAAGPADRIVDVGCGAGELTRAVAAARPQAKVIGLDISPDLVAAATSADGAPANARFALADAAIWPGPGAPVDLYVSRHGVMFFADPPKAFAHLARLGAPGARFVFSCFRAAAQNVWASGLAALLPPSAPAAASVAIPPGPFAFADPDHVRRCMAGWHDIAFTAVDFSYVAGAGDDPVADALDFFGRIGPAAAAMRALPGEERKALESRLIAFLEAHVHNGVVGFPAAAWIVSAAVDAGAW